MPKLPRVTSREVVTALKRMGFVEIRQRGSHMMLANLVRNKQCTVAIHSQEIIAPKTLQQILTQAGIPLEDFIQAL